MLPTFLVVGAPRSGTTSLYHYCSQHPEIYMSPIKEVNYFSSNNYNLTKEKYKKIFEPGRDHKACGEVSPSYLRQKNAPDRIAALMPDCKIIIILRDPVARFLSDFKYSRRFGFHPAPLKNYLPFSGTEEDDLPEHFRMHTMKKKGLYANQVERYTDIIKSQNVLVLLFEDLVEEAADLIREVYKFLEVDETFVPDVGVRHNLSREARWPALARWMRPGGRVWRALTAMIGPSASNRVVSRVEQLNSQPASFHPDEASIREVRSWYDDDVRHLELVLDRKLDDWLTQPNTYIPSEKAHA